MNHVIADFVDRVMHKSNLITRSILYALASGTKEDTLVTNPTNTVASVTAVTTDTTPPRSFLALGDSYTIGQSVTESDRFPVQTVGYLN